ncbi:MAG: aminopeptidase P family protein [Paracoccaceae bacterium]
MFQTFEPSAGGTESPVRIRALRKTLADAGFDGMLVPRTDAHQGETVAPRDERLAWLTGFTGSAGLAVVLPGRAALFVDGRYTLQGAEQTDGDTVEVVATHETSLEAWLKGALDRGAVLGFDPWLHGRAEIARLRTAVEATGAALRPLRANPIDRLWQDRPAPPMAAMQIHDEALAGESAASKRARLGRELAEAGHDAAVLSLPDSIAWLLNVRGGDLAHVPVTQAFAILTTDGGVRLFVEPDKVSGAVADWLGAGVRLQPPSAFEDALDRLSDARVLLDEATAPLAVADRLEAAGATLAFGSDPCLLPKACKTEAELAGMRAAHLRDGVAVTRCLAWLEGEAEAARSPDEIAIVERLEAFRRATGELRDISFDTISGAGPHGAIVHYRVTRASNRQLAPGEILLLDSGGQYRDGTTDITRTVAFAPRPEDLPEAPRRPFTLVLKGLIAISRARFPAGLTGRDLDPLARAALWRAGYDYQHGTGHGVGTYLNVHEGPAALSRRSGTVALRPGMVLSNEPGYYREGAFGIRLENLVAVTPAAIPEGGDREMLGFEDLTLCPFDRRLILPELLDGEERAWLDAYHARVRTELSPHLDGAEADWLDRATAPL